MNADKINAVKFAPFLLILILTVSIAIANGGEEAEHLEEDEHSEDEHAAQQTVGLEQSIKSNTLKIIAAATAIVLALILFATLNKRLVDKSNKVKAVIFSLIVIVVVAATAYTAGSTIYLNVISETGGPVHWHADFEVWNCGEKLDLADPSGLANRVGTSTFHEHGDDRIHLEGVVVEKADVSLHNFFHVIGGELEENSLSIPTNAGVTELRNGNACNGKEGTLQVFVYKIKNPDDRKEWTYEQIKLDDIGNYVLSPHTNVPPGDCIIIEFDEDKDSTDKICETYRIAIDRGELSGG